MARANSIIANGLSGQIGKQLVYRQYGNKTVVSRYPDMSNIKPSKKQKAKRSRFAKAVAYAQSILRDPAKKAAYLKKTPKDQQVYHFAMKEYLSNNP